MKIFEEPDLKQAPSRELFETKQEREETLEDYMSPVQVLVKKSFRKLDLQNRESIAVTAFCKGLVEQDAAMLAAVQSEGKVAKAMKIAASVTALSATPHVRTSQAKQYNAKSNRYLTNVAMDEGEEKLGGEGEESQDWAEEGEEQDEECFVATTNSPHPRGAFRGAMRRYLGSRPLRARSRGAPGVGNVAGSVQVSTRDAIQIAMLSERRVDPMRGITSTADALQTSLAHECLVRRRQLQPTKPLPSNHHFLSPPIHFPISPAMQRLPLLMQRRQRREINRLKGQHLCLGRLKGRQDEAIPRRREIK